MIGSTGTSIASSASTWGPAPPRSSASTIYLDRLREATGSISNVEGSIEFHSALAVATGAFERLDRRYVLRRIREIEEREGRLGERMRRLDRRIRHLAKRSRDADSGRKRR
jgi:hypothetical protein